VKKAVALNWNPEIDNTSIMLFMVPVKVYMLLKLYLWKIKRKRKLCVIGYIYRY